MVANFVAGGAAIDALASAVDADVVVLDVGVAEVDAGTADARPRGGRLVADRVADGTADMTERPAMTRAETEAAIDAGARLVDARAPDGLDILGLGEMGIGNTTAASALVAALTGVAVAEVTGRRTGVDLAGHARRSRRRTRVGAPPPGSDDPIGVLAAVGGLGSRRSSAHCWPPHRRGSGRARRVHHRGGHSSPRASIGP